MHILNFVNEILAVPIQWFKVVNALVYSHLGFWGQITFDLLLLYLLFLIIFKVTQAVIRCVFYIVIPSLVLSLASSYFLPFSLSVILPVCVVLLIAINIVRS
jgi:hypothetical protein